MASALPNVNDGSSGTTSPSTNGSEEVECMSLPECFDRAFKTHQYCDKTDDSSSSDKFQGRLRQAIQSTERAITMVNELNLFSSNEDIEEVATNEVKYMLLSAFLGYFAGLNTHMARKEAVNKSKLCYTDFLKLLKSYSVIDYDIALTEDDETEDSSKTVVPYNRSSRVPDMNAMSAQRNNKIQRFREKKDMERKLAELQPLVEREHVDDEVKREFYLTQIKHWAHLAVDEVDSCNLELKMLEHRQDLAKSAAAGNAGNHSDNRPEKNKSKPLRPFILTKSALQKQVFGAGYPGIATMTVDEFYQQKLKEGHLSESVQGHSMQNWAQNPEQDAEDREREAAEAEEKVEREEEEAIQRARAMDEWKDDHRRGDGNRYNKG